MTSLDSMPAGCHRHLLMPPPSASPQPFSTSSSPMLSCRLADRRPAFLLLSLWIQIGCRGCRPHCFLALRFSMTGWYISSWLACMDRLLLLLLPLMMWGLVGAWKERRNVWLRLWASFHRQLLGCSRFNCTWTWSDRSSGEKRKERQRIQPLSLSCLLISLFSLSNHPRLFTPTCGSWPALLASLVWVHVTRLKTFFILLEVRGCYLQKKCRKPNYL